MPSESIPESKKHHDAGYKRLFSHAEFVQDLVTGFIPELGLQGLDFSTLQRCPGSYITDDLRERADDIIWRIKSGDTWLYLYLLIEFQSTIDPYMAVRILTYVGLLYQDLIRSNVELEPGSLPPILPIVLYNGKPRWTAVQDIAEQIPKLPKFLEVFRPHLRYLLIEERAYTDSKLAELRNLTAAIFRLEHLANPETALEIIAALNAWLIMPKQKELRRSIAIWIRDALKKHEQYALILPEIDDLQEIYSMLSEQVGEWAKQYRSQGRQEGHQEGRQEGRQEGIQEGIQKGEQLFLMRLLERKFGVLDESAKARLTAANTSTLLIWGDAVLEAKQLSDVLGADN